MSIQPAHAKANLQFVSLCCPTLLLESTAFLWKLVEFMLGFREPTPVEMSLPGFSGQSPEKGYNAPFGSPMPCQGIGGTDGPDAFKGIEPKGPLRPLLASHWTAGNPPSRA